MLHLPSLHIWACAATLAVATAALAPEAPACAPRPHDATALLQTSMEGGAPSALGADTLDNLTSSRQTSNGLAELRVLLYVTTGGSPHHTSFLECYAYVLTGLPRLAKADAMWYVAESAGGPSRQQYQELLDAWPVGRKSIHYDADPDLRKGSLKAVHVGLSSGWFEGYDWVVRIQPDVVVWDERPLFQLLERPQNWGVFVRCGPALGGSLAYNSFFALRPQRLPKGLFSAWRLPQASGAFGGIRDAGAYAFLEHSEGSSCRAEGGGLLHSSKDCPELLARPSVSASDHGEWKEAWKDVAAAGRGRAQGGAHLAHEGA